jgi:transcriptional regulator with XRE-family HTH domain
VTVPRKRKPVADNGPSPIGERLEEAIRRFYGSVALDPATMELAEATGLSRSQINKIRNGTTRRPHLSTLRRLADRLNVTVEWLRDGARFQQLDAFAIALPTPQEAETADPATKLVVLLKTLEDYSRDVQVRACREAVSAILDVLASAGELMPEAYQTLAYLDGLGRATRNRDRSPAGGER